LEIIALWRKMRASLPRTIPEFNAESRPLLGPIARKLTRRTCGFGKGWRRERNWDRTFSASCGVPEGGYLSFQPSGALGPCSFREPQEGKRPSRAHSARCLASIAPFDRLCRHRLRPPSTRPFVAPPCSIFSRSRSAQRSLILACILPRSSSAAAVEMPPLGAGVFPCAAFRPGGACARSRNGRDLGPIALLHFALDCSNEPLGTAPELVVKTKPPEWDLHFTGVFHGSALPDRYGDRSPLGTQHVGTMPRAPRLTSRVWMGTSRQPHMTKWPMCNLYSITTIKARWPSSSG
jgi:hypothetical protein